MITTLLPQLPRHSRPAFRWGLVGLVALLVVLIELRWQTPLIGLSALGLPLLFVFYLAETRCNRRIRLRTLTVTAILAGGAGLGWAIATGAIWARTYDDVLGTPMDPHQRLINLVIIPVVGVVLMLLPVTVLRVRRPASAGALDGFVLGALGALAFTAAGIITRAAPDFANGIVAEDIPLDALWALVTVRGVAAPLIAVAVGGMVGAALWFRPGADPPVGRHWHSMTAPTPALAAAVVIYGAQNAVDYAWISYAQIVGLYVAITVAALGALRIVLHASLRGERHQGFEAARPVGHTSTARLLLLLGTSTAVVMAVTIGFTLWLTPAPADYTCPPDCGRPPIGQPVTTNPVFTPTDGAFTVSYPGPSTAYETTLQSDGVVAELRAGDGGTLHLFGAPAADRTPRQIAEELLADDFPNAAISYQIPNAQVGYQQGYGVVADVFKAGTAGDSARVRVLVIVAVKHRLALVAVGAGPYREFTPDFGSGHPSGANFQLALDMSKYVNGFSWRGDPPR